MLFHFASKAASDIVVQTPLFRHLNRVAPIDQPDHEPIHCYAAEFFHHVECERRLARAVRVNEACKGVQPGKVQRIIHPRPQNSVAVVEQAVDRVSRAACGALRPAVYFWNNVPQRSPVLRCRVRLECH